MPLYVYAPLCIPLCFPVLVIKNNQKYTESMPPWMTPLWLLERRRRSTRRPPRCAVLALHHP